MGSPRSIRSLAHLTRVEQPARPSSQLNKRDFGVRTWKLLTHDANRALYLLLPSPNQYLDWALLLLVYGVVCVWQVECGR